MKILHIINSLNIGGAEKLLTSYVCETKDRQENYIFLLDDAETFLYDKVISSGIKVISCENKNLVKQFLYLINIVRKENFDVIHSHLFPSLYLVAILRIFFKKPKYIFTEHNVTNRRRKSVFVRPIERLVYSQYDVIIGCANIVKIELEKWIGNKNNIIVVPNGVDSYDSLDIEKVYDIILVGSLRSNVKGVDILLQSLNIIRNDFNKCIIVGDGIEKENLIELRNKLNLEEKVDFLGFRNDIDILLNQSKIFVMPSRYEGMPLALLEAMSCGKIIIASNIDSISTIIIDNENGLLFESGNISLLAEKIRYILNNENLAIKLEKRSKYDFKEKFSISRYIRDIENIYN